MPRAIELAILFLLFCTGPARGAGDAVAEPLRDLASLKQATNPARLRALEKMLEARGIPCERQTFSSAATPNGRTRGTNLIVTFGTGGREITLGAHYDALELPEGGLVDGMIDNGAATIILVRIAEALRGTDLRHRVRIVFFDMEETGFTGSRAYVAAGKSEIAAAIILDIAGFGDSLGYGTGKSGNSLPIRKALLASCAERLLTCLDSPNYPASDNVSFQNAGIPVVSIGFQPRLAMVQTWLALNGGSQSGLRKGFVPPDFDIIPTPEDNLGRIEPEAIDLEYRLVLDVLRRLDASLE